LVSRFDGAVLIGIGNSYRRDDGIGPAIAAAISEHDLPGVTVLTSDGEPSRLLDAWSGARLAVVVDAVRGGSGVPGTIHRRSLLDGQAQAQGGLASTHGFGLEEAVELARAMERMPERLVVFAVEAADTGHGPGLSEAVAARLPELTRLVLAELGTG
jgi:hydrogenase maturation protease